MYDHLVGFPGNSDKNHSTILRPPIPDIIKNRKCINKILLFSVIIKYGKFRDVLESLCEPCRKPYPKN